jgi:hypothetical protein
MLKLDASILQRLRILTGKDFDKADLIIIQGSVTSRRSSRDDTSCCALDNSPLIPE